MKRLALILTLALTTATAVSVSPAGAVYVDPFAWKKCNQKVDFNLKITAVRNMRCRGARGVMRHYDGSISRRFRTEGFSCKRVKGSAASGVWRCKRGQKAFKFAFGD